MFPVDHRQCVIEVKWDDEEEANPGEDSGCVEDSSQAREEHDVQQELGHEVDRGTVATKYQDKGQPYESGSGGLTHTGGGREAAGHAALGLIFILLTFLTKTEQFMVHHIQTETNTYDRHLHDQSSNEMKYAP